MFEEYTDNPEMELKVRVININGDADILNKLQDAQDYMTFVRKTRYKTDVEDKDVKTAVTEAIDRMCRGRRIYLSISLKTQRGRSLK